MVKKVPKGTSAYQAEWILDEDGESGGEGDEYDDIEHEDFMEEDSQVRTWALGQLLYSRKCKARCSPDLKVYVWSVSEE